MSDLPGINKISQDEWMCIAIVPPTKRTLEIREFHDHQCGVWGVADLVRRNTININKLLSLDFRDDGFQSRWFRVVGGAQSPHKCYSGHDQGYRCGTIQRTTNSMRSGHVSMHNKNNWGASLGLSGLIEKSVAVAASGHICGYNGSIGQRAAGLTVRWVPRMRAGTTRDRAAPLCVGSSTVVFLLPNLTQAPAPASSTWRNPGLRDEDLGALDESRGQGAHRAAGAVWPAAR